MVQFLKIAIETNYKNFENIIDGPNYFIFNILLIAMDLNFLRTAPLPIHKVIIISVF